MWQSKTPEIRKFAKKDPVHREEIVCSPSIPLLCVSQIESTSWPESPTEEDIGTHSFPNLVLELIIDKNKIFSPIRMLKENTGEYIFCKKVATSKTPDIYVRLTHQIIWHKITFIIQKTAILMSNF